MRITGTAATRAPAERGIVMRRSVIAAAVLTVGTVLGGGLLGAAPAWATPPTQLHQVPFNFSIHNDALSDACGFDVFDVLAGNVDTTLFYDQSGTLTREIDTSPSLTLSLAAPSTGKSIGSRSPAVMITDYTGGGALGTAAVASLTGLQLMLGPGVMFTGNQVFDAVVVDHSPDGVPIIEFTNLISESGNFFSGDFAGVVCPALSGP